MACEMKVIGVECVRERVFRRIVTEQMQKTRHRLIYGPARDGRSERVLRVASALCAGTRISLISLAIGMALAANGIRHLVRSEIYLPSLASTLTFLRTIRIARSRRPRYVYKKRVHQHRAVDSANFDERLRALLPFEIYRA